MKYLTIILATMLHFGMQAQRYSEEAKAAAEMTNEMLGVDSWWEIDTSGTVPITLLGNSILVFDPDGDQLRQPITQNTIIDYLNSLSWVEVHKWQNIGVYPVGVCPMTYPDGPLAPARCSVEEHYKTVRQTPTFEGFINWLLNPKQ